MLGFLVGIAEFLAALVPDLFDTGGDDLQGLERLDRFLIETKNEKLAPMTYFRWIAFDLAQDILSGLGGEIHENRRSGFLNDAR